MFLAKIIKGLWDKNYYLCILKITKELIGNQLRMKKFLYFFTFQLNYGLIEGFVPLGDEIIKQTENRCFCDTIGIH